MQAYRLQAWRCGDPRFLRCSPDLHGLHQADCHGRQLALVRLWPGGMEKGLGVGRSAQLAGGACDTCKARRFVNVQDGRRKNYSVAKGRWLRSSIRILFAVRLRPKHFIEMFHGVLSSSYISVPCLSIPMVVDCACWAASAEGVHERDAVHPLKTSHSGKLRVTMHRSCIFRTLGEVNAHCAHRRPPSQIGRTGYQRSLRTPRRTIANGTLH